jgi:hypothetical protein
LKRGTLSFQGVNFGNIAGPLQIASGAEMTFDTTNGVYIRGAFTSTDCGTLTVTGGWFDGPNAYFGGDPTATASLNFAPNTLYFEGGYIDSDQQTNLINTGTAYFQGGGPMATMENAGFYS